MWRPWVESNHLRRFWRPSGNQRSHGQNFSIVPGWTTGFEPANTRVTTSRSSNRASPTPQRSKDGADRHRTCDLKFTKLALCLLSYIGNLEPSARIGLASQPYQSCILPLDDDGGQTFGGRERARTVTYILTRDACCHSHSTASRFLHLKNFRTRRTVNVLNKMRRTRVPHDELLRCEHHPKSSVDCKDGARLYHRHQSGATDETRTRITHADNVVHCHCATVARKLVAGPDLNRRQHGYEPCDLPG